MSICFYCDTHREMASSHVKIIQIFKNNDIECDQKHWHWLNISAKKAIFSKIDKTAILRFPERKINITIRKKVPFKKYTKNGAPSEISE